MAKLRTSNAALDMFSGGGRKAAKPPAPATAPSLKSRQQAELPGTDLAAMADKQEGLLERVMTRKKGSDPETAKADLAALHGVLTGLSQKTVVVIFAFGKLRTEVKESLPHGNFIPWIEDGCPFHFNTAARYMRVYERYKSAPLRALAELSITEAYLEAGVKKLAAPEQEDDDTHRRGTLEVDEIGRAHV